MRTSIEAVPFELPDETKTGASPCRLNLLPIQLLTTEISLLVYTTEGPGRYDIPIQWISQTLCETFPRHPILSHDRLWVGFERRDTKADLIFMIDLEKHKRLKLLYVKHQIEAALKSKDLICRQNFVDELVVWMPGHHTDKLFNYDSFKLKVVRFNDTIALRCSWLRSHQVIRMPMSEFNGKFPELAEKVRMVICGNQLVNVKDKQTYDNLDLSKTFAILNKDMYRNAGKNTPYQRQTQKHRLYLDRIEGFKTQYLEDLPCDKLRIGNKWMAIAPLAVVRPTDSRLQFGRNELEQVVYKGLKNFGPIIKPHKKSIRVFFLSLIKDRELKNFTATKLFHPEDGLSAFAKMPVLHDKALDIEAKDMAELQNRLEAWLNNAELSDEYHYVALLLLPISRYQSPEAMERKYYELKDHLLQRDIVSQLIDSTKLEQNKAGFGFWIVNIASAMIAKTGGIPWKIGAKEGNELVIGFGLYRSKKYQKEMLGTTFCFGSDGHFYEFESFKANHPTAAALRVDEAIRHFVKIYGQPGQVVVHYHKQISNKEFEPVLQSIRNLGKDIRLHVLKFNRQGSSDYAIRDTGDPSAYPEDGSVFALGYGNYLLYINGRKENTPTKVEHLPLRVYLHKSEPEADDETVKTLLEQVYRFASLNYRSAAPSSTPVTALFPLLYASQKAWFVGESELVETSKKLWFL